MLYAGDAGMHTLIEVASELKPCVNKLGATTVLKLASKPPTRLLLTTIRVTFARTVALGRK